MFTGIVSRLGTIVSNEGRTLTVKAALGKLKIGDSVAVNGTCLTLTRQQGSKLAFDVGPETKRLTNLGFLKSGERVNLELPLKAADFIGGHWVTGHVDANAAILEKFPLKDGFARLKVFLPKTLSALVAPKGSITVDGVSLTVVRKGKGFFEIMLIPETLKRTTLGVKKRGDGVNLEADLLARTVWNILESRRAPR